MNSGNSSYESTFSSSAKTTDNSLLQNNLSFNDTQYPFANIPRIVIETHNKQQITDTQTEIEAKVQLWSKERPTTNVLEATIRGRGNSSWNMPKKGYKIEFKNKQEILSMPQDKDWVLIANYSDKTLIKNYITNRLSEKLGMCFTPKSTFVEVFLNDDYLGVYLISETVKVGENRVNISQTQQSFLVEFDRKYKEGEQVIFSDVITSNNIGKPYHVHFPRKASDEALNSLKNHLETFETNLIQNSSNNFIDIDQWIDVNESVKHYWLQEFSKNPDGIFSTSVYFTWNTEEPIKMGPIWDFDLAYGGHSEPSVVSNANWYLRNSYWNKYLFQHEIYLNQINAFWKENRHLFEISDIADSLAESLELAAKNNFKKWDILKSTDFAYHKKSYNSFKEAIDDLKNWVSERAIWIDNHVQ